MDRSEKRFGFVDTRHDGDRCCGTPLPSRSIGSGADASVQCAALSVPEADVDRRHDGNWCSCTPPPSRCIGTRHGRMQTAVGEAHCSESMLHHKYKRKHSSLFSRRKSVFRQNVHAWHEAPTVDTLLKAFSILTRHGAFPKSQSAVGPLAPRCRLLSRRCARREWRRAGPQ